MGNRVNKRQFLRGMGVCIGLPPLLAGTRVARAAISTNVVGTTRLGAPLRTAFIFFPNGAIPKSWWPDKDGKDYSLPPTLEPLRRVQKHFQILGGLNQVNADPGEDGAGDHARGNAVFLTSVRIHKSATELRAGPSIDQVMARSMSSLTRFPSLEMSTDPVRRSSDCDSGYSCAYQFNLSWQTATTPSPAESNPRLVFERLFGAGPHGQRAANQLQRMAEQRSLLDFVMTDAAALQSRSGREDRQKIDEYLTGVRSIETRIQNAERFGPNIDPDRPTPAGVPEVLADHIALMFDMLLLAFQSDSTRIATMMLGHDGDNRSFGEIGINEGHHDLSHHQNKSDRIEKVASIDRWYVEQFARFLEKCESVRDTDGNSILYNSRILYGSGNADGDRHTHTNLPILLAGQGGGLLNTGRHVKHGGKPLANLFLSLAQQAGIRGLDRFGDSTGHLTGL